MNDWLFALSAGAGISAAGPALARLQSVSGEVSMDTTVRVTRAGIAMFPAAVRVDF
jgi:hypothetical protein